MLLLWLVLPSLLALLQHRVGIKIKFCALDSEGFSHQLSCKSQSLGLVGSFRPGMQVKGQVWALKPSLGWHLWWMWGCSLSVPYLHIQGQPQSSGGVAINCVMPSELTFSHKPGFLIESSRLIRVLGMKTWGMCAGTHPPNKGTAVVFGAGGIAPSAGDGAALVQLWVITQTALGS